MEAILLKLANICISVGMDKIGKLIQNKFTKKHQTLSIEEIKKRTQVLFVDDEDFSAKLSSIRGAGWNVNQINDVTNFNCEEVKNADIIFMDYVGVGKVLTPSEQGIGLLREIKKRYPGKFIIFLSGYAGLIPGHEVHSIADAWIDKHADSYVYIDQIEAAAVKIHG